MGKKDGKKGGKKENKGISKKMLELFYMTGRSVSGHDIKNVILAVGGKVQFWEEMNVLQIECLDESTVDFELFSSGFKDALDIAFIEEHKVKSIYLVTLEESAFAEVKPVFKELSRELEGFFCTDSEDFRPIYRVEDLS